MVVHVEKECAVLALPHAKAAAQMDSASEQLQTWVSTITVTGTTMRCTAAGAQEPINKMVSSVMWLTCLSALRNDIWYAAPADNCC